VTSLALVLDQHPEYRTGKVLERIVEPERVIMFRVPCQDDRGEINATYLMKNNVWLIAEGANMPSIWDADDISVDNRPHGIMINLHGARREATETYNTPGNYVNGANISAQGRTFMHCFHRCNREPRKN